MPIKDYVLADSNTIGILIGEIDKLRAELAKLEYENQILRGVVETLKAHSSSLEREKTRKRIEEIKANG
jgi:regulator of replication initiation timing